MDTIGRNLLKLSASLLGIALAAGTVNAQDTPTQAGTIDEIIVTSEFREASLQETPIAITAVTGDMLAEEPDCTYVPQGYRRDSSRSEFVSYEH